MIRRLAPGDAAVFRSIRLEALRADPAAFASRLEDWAELPEAEWERRLAVTPVFVDFEGDEPVGIIGLMPQAASKMAHRATLVMAYLRAALRRRGRAEALLGAAADYALAVGLRQLELTVSAENPVAIGFYERMGFVRVGRIPASLLHEGREIDELMMVRRLSG